MTYLSRPILLAHSPPITFPVECASWTTSRWFTLQSILLQKQRALPCVRPLCSTSYFRTDMLHNERALWGGCAAVHLLVLEGRRTVYFNENFTDFWERFSKAARLQRNCLHLHRTSSCAHINMNSFECNRPGWRMLQDVSSIYLWSCTSAFSAIEPSAAVSQGKLTSLLIALLVITECSWSTAVSSLEDI